MNTVSVQLPPLMLAAFFSSTVVGFYALGHRLLSMPMSLLGRALAQVFFQRAAIAKNNGMLPAVVKNVFVKLMAIGVFPLLLVLLAGKEIFTVVFGAQWAEAGVYAQILAPWMLFVFLGSPISTLFSILEMQETGLIFNSVLLVTRVLSILIGGLADNILLALLLYSGTGTVMWCGFCLYLLKKAEVMLSNVYRDAIKIVTMVILACLPLVVLKFFAIRPQYVVIACCLSALLYYTLLYFHDDDIRTLLASYMGRITTKE